MKNLIRPTIALTSILCSVSPLYAQDLPAPSGEFRIGVSGGVIDNVHTGAARMSSRSGRAYFGDSLGCGCRLAANEDHRWGHSIGLVVEYAFDDVFSLASHFLYSTHPRSGVGQFPNAQVLLPSPDPDAPPEIVDQTAQWEFDIWYDLFEMDVLGKARFLPVENGGLGGAFGFAVGHTVTLEESDLQRIVSPDNARFISSDRYQMRENNRVMVFAEDESIENASSTRLSLRSGVFYDITLFDKIHVTPAVYFDYGLTHVVNESTWQMHAVMFQLDVTTQR